MSSFKPLDSKREDFRKYLEKAGVTDALTKVLIGLYEKPEKPEDALDYFRKQLGGDTSELEAELETAKAKIAELEAEIATLKIEPSPVTENTQVEN